MLHFTFDFRSTSSFRNCYQLFTISRGANFTNILWAHFRLVFLRQKSLNLNARYLNITFPQCKYKKAESKTFVLKRSSLNVGEIDHWRSGKLSNIICLKICSCKHGKSTTDTFPMFWAFQTFLGHPFMTSYFYRFWHTPLSSLLLVHLVSILPKLVFLCFQFFMLCNFLLCNKRK